MKKPQFAEHFLRLVVAYSQTRNISTDDREIMLLDWFDAFGSTHPEVWAGAVAEWKRRSKFFPSQAEMHDVVLEVNERQVLAERRQQALAADAERAALGIPERSPRLAELATSVKRAQRVLGMADDPPRRLWHPDPDLKELTDGR